MVGGRWRSWFDRAVGCSGAVARGGWGSGCDRAVGCAVALVRGRLIPVRPRGGLAGMTSLVLRFVSSLPTLSANEMTNGFHTLVVCIKKQIE